MLFQELGKLKRSSIMNSIVMMAVGILMIICPGQYVNSLVSVLGYGMLVYAAVLVLDFISGKRVLMNYIYLTGALVMALVGAAILVFDSDVVRVIGLVFGIWLIGVGAIDIASALMYARRAGSQGWRLLAVLSVLLILCGLIVLVNPWWSKPTKLFDVIGGMLLFSSVVSIVRLVLVWPIKGE